MRTKLYSFIFILGEEYVCIYIFNSELKHLFLQYIIYT